MWFIIVRKSGIGSDVWNMIISPCEDDVGINGRRLKTCHTTQGKSRSARSKENEKGKTHKILTKICDVRYDEEIWKLFEIEKQFGAFTTLFLI